MDNDAKACYDRIIMSLATNNCKWALLITKEHAEATSKINLSNAISHQNSARSVKSILPRHTRNTITWIQTRKRISINIMYVYYQFNHHDNLSRTSDRHATKTSQKNYNNVLMDTLTTHRSSRVSLKNKEECQRLPILRNNYKTTQEYGKNC
jgi:hypothetical protein